MYAIEYYQRENGVSPVKEFVESLNASGNWRLLKTIDKYIGALKEHGKLMNSEFSRNTFEQLEPDLYEIKPGMVRILLTFKDGTFFLLHAFYKKSNKTPEQDKAVARRRLRQITPSN